MRFSQAAATLPPSGIRELMELAWAAGEVIHLEVGEPSFATPPHVVEAADRAARDGWTRYTPSAGVPALREAIAAKVGRLNGYPVQPDQVVVTAGGIEAIYLAMLGVLEPGEEVLLPDPGWPNFRMMARLAHAVERLYPLRPELGFPPPRTWSGPWGRAPGRSCSTRPRTRWGRSSPRPPGRAPRPGRRP
jgi:aspartate aminotransferase